MYDDDSFGFVDSHTPLLILTNVKAPKRRLFVYNINVVQY